MATSSILKSVAIKSRAQAERFILALEKAEEAAQGGGYMEARWPKESQVRREGDKATIDYGYINEGYVTVWVYDDDPEKKHQIQVAANGHTQNFKGLPKNGAICVPLPFGSGRYAVRVLRYVSGITYRLVAEIVQDVKLVDEFGPWLRPTCYANYSPESQCVKVAEEVCRGIEPSIGRIRAIAEWVVGWMEYDVNLAATVNDDKTKFWLPAPDEALMKKKGICWEYSSLAAAMMRSQGIPCKIAVGHAGQAYHSWNEVYAETGGELADGFALEAGMWHSIDLTVADGPLGRNAKGDWAGMRMFAKDNAYSVEYYG